MIPYIILFDLDGTIVGNVSPLVTEWELLHKNDKKKIKDFKKAVVKKLQNGVMRPHLADFCSMVSRHLRYIEFFIYTASDPTWAVFLVSCLEEATGLCFQRPIFTRNNCLLKDGDFTKSIECVSPLILKKLKSKYKDLTKVSQLKNRICLIDNNEVLSKGERSKLIKCPTYDYIDNYDIFSRLDIDTFSEKDCNDLASSLRKYGLFPSQSSTKTSRMSFDVFRYYYYSRLCDNLKKSIKQESNVNTDRYWMALANTICNESIECFDSSTIKKVDSKVNASKVL